MERAVGEVGSLPPEQILRDLYLHSGAALLVVGVDGRIMHVNPGLCEILARTEESVVGRPLEEFAPRLAARLEEEARLEEAEEVRSFHKRLVRPDRTRVDLIVGGRLVRDDDGEPRYWVCHVNDVTALQHAQHEAARAEAQQRAVVSLGRAALEEGTLDDVFKLAVDVVAEHLPVDRAVVIAAEPDGDGLIRARTGDELPGEPRVPLSPQFRSALESSDGIVTTDLAAESRFAPDQRLVDAGFRSTVSARIVVGGHAWGFVAAASRSTFRLSDGDRVFLETIAATLAAGIARRSYEQLEREAFDQQRQASIGVAAAGIAHALGNSLAVLRSQAELLRLHHSSVDGELGTIVREIDHMALMIEQLLARAPGRDQAMTVFDAASHLRNSVPVLRRLLPEGVRWKTEISRKRCFVRASLRGFDQAVLNLVRNAGEADEQGHVVLRCEVEGPEVVVAVSDEGPGMSPGVAERAFESFFTTKAGSGGTGLGLAQVRNFVSDAAGRVELDTGDTGTTVRMRLPRTSAAREMGCGP